MNIKKFSASKWKHRTDTVQTPELAPWCAEDEKAECIVRNLDAVELACANEAAGQASKRAAIAEGLAGRGAEITDAIRQFIGAAGDAPADHVRRLELLQLGSVKPVFDLPAAMHLATNLPATFMLLTNRILELTGMGAEPGKPKGSGKSRASEPQ